MEHELNEINVIPLVDVMLVLLVIVLTTATFITTGQIPVDLAKAKEAGDRQETSVVITVKKEGILYINDQRCTKDELIPLLLEYPRETIIVVRADRTIILERFVEVVDHVRGEGYDQVSLEVARL